MNAKLRQRLLHFLQVTATLVMSIISSIIAFLMLGINIGAAARNGTIASGLSRFAIYLPVWSWVSCLTIG